MVIRSARSFTTDRLARYVRRAVLGLALVTGATLGPMPQVATAENLVPLVRGLKWPHVSGMIGYRGRLWFVNSRKYVNHNSADIHSYDPATGKARYERHLFSQDAGEPVIARGLLYWPFEDSRWSPGRGEFMVTNGTEWRWGLLPEGRAFHVHSMTYHGGRLYAAPSAWKARLQRSADLGGTWKPVYVYPAPDGRVSRITTLRSLNGSLYGGLTAWWQKDTPKLLRWRGDTFQPVRGWPQGMSVSELEPYRGWLYGDNDPGESDDDAVWRTNGKKVERVEGLDGHAVRGLAAGPKALWAITVTRRGGELWRSADGVEWRRVQTFRDLRLADVFVYAGRVYVGAFEKGEGGVLLGPQAPAPVEAAGALPALPAPAKPPAFDAAASFAKLDEILGNSLRYNELRGHMVPFALTRDPAIGRELAKRLDGRLPYGQASMFGGQVKVSAAKMARWYLMWAMAHNGHGRVPPHLIRWPWDVNPNRAEKYLEPAPGAAWAAAQIGQKDSETLRSLVGRLNSPGNLDWLDGDMVGALTTLTGQRFAYDIQAWVRWWESRQGVQ